MIPKIIHQTWKTKNLDCFSSCVESIKNLHKDYQYKFYSDEECRNIVKEDFKEFLNVYDSMVPVEKADLFRYLIVYRDGGVYLDIDCFCIKNLDYLIEGQEFVAGYEQGWLEEDLMRYTQWAFAAEKEHPIMLESAYRCKKNHLKCSNMWTLKKTGPTMWTKVINEFQVKSKRKLNLGSESWFGSRIFGVNSKNTVPVHERRNIIKGINKQIADSKQIYVVHLFYGSWHKGKKTNMETVSELRAIEHMIK